MRAWAVGLGLDRRTDVSFEVGQDVLDSALLLALIQEHSSSGETNRRVPAAAMVETDVSRAGVPSTRHRRLILDALLHAATESGGSDVLLGTDTGWQAAHAFYRAHGFEPVAGPREGTYHGRRL